MGDETGQRSAVIGQRPMDGKCQVHLPLKKAGCSGGILPKAKAWNSPYGCPLQVRKNLLFVSVNLFILIFLYYMLY
ncbi:hypothetical protein [uncultured Acidaminococcus sp.]|uniref:hypothetical protein n=1 Tax=uncultured Acidaminococcus sp. TaxID=352152 RepID=UPI00266F30CD|nr:hypothetical protein [uncultured Acidaminococcus sp.]